MKQFLFAVAALALVGCGYEAESTLIFIPAGETLENEVAQLAASQWNACHKAQLGITNDPALEDAIPLSMSSKKLFDDDGVPAGGVTHFDFFDNPEWIQIYRYENLDQLLKVTLHEFGHILTGKEHSKTGVMARGIEMPSQLTVSDCDRINWDGE